MSLERDPQLHAMVAEARAGPPLYRPSNFWQAENATNLRMLDECGIENFKRTVAQNYYNWLVVSPRDIQFRNALRDWILHPKPAPFLNRMEAPELLRTTTGLERRIGRRHLLAYKLFVGMLWEHAAREDRFGLAATLEEPSLGNPISITRRGRRISQDLANSIREYNSIVGGGSGLGAGAKTIAELGAGYGRLAHVFLADGASRYFIFDIPPALYVSQWYLTRLFPEKRVFGFRPIASFAEVEGELARSDIAFFTPNQLELFPDRAFDAVVSISTLPEMTRAQIDNYLALMARLASRGVYLKQWLRWRNALDGHEVEPGTFALGAGWELALDRQDAIQSLFFERLWRRRAQ